MDVTWQVKFAFIAGVAVVLLLIPVNHWLATKIESASTVMMACKDLRIKRMGELLKGIRQIKAAAWEPNFTARVRPSAASDFEISSAPTLQCSRFLLGAPYISFWLPILVTGSAPSFQSVRFLLGAPYISFWLSFLVTGSAPSVQSACCLLGAPYISLWLPIHRSALQSSSKAAS